MRQETINLYSISELDYTAKQRAFQQLAEFAASDSGWYESTIDNAKEIGKILGIDIDNIYFSGFWSQGAGACFTGSYEYAKKSAKKIREYAPMDTELHNIADSLTAIQKKHFCRLSATINHADRYYHEYTTSICVFDESNPYTVIDADEETADTVADLLRDFMRWIYSPLESEYEYQTSEETLTDNAEANEYEFTETGELA